MEDEYDDEEYDYEYSEDYWETTTSANTSEWIYNNSTNATTLAPDKRALAKVLEDKLYHLKLWTILLISCIGLILFLASLWIGRKTLSRVQRLGIMKPSRMSDIWANVQVINFWPAVLFKKSSNDISKRQRKGEDSPIIHSSGSQSDYTVSPSQSRSRTYASPGPVFDDAPVSSKRRREEFSKQRSRSMHQPNLSPPLALSSLDVDLETGHRKRSSSESSTGRMKFSPHYDDEEEQIVYKIVAV